MKFYRSLAPIKALTFDLDDTLYDNRPVVLRMEAELLSWLHREHPQTQRFRTEQWLEIKAAVSRKHPAVCHDVTLWREKQLQTAFLQLGYTPEEAQQAAKDGVAVALSWRSRLTVPPQTHQVLSALAGEFPLVAITNGNVDTKVLGLDVYFKAVLQAGPDGAAKPAADLFLLAQSMLPCSPANILHVGDHLLKDVAAANQHGFMSCWNNTTHRSLYRNAKARSLPHLEIRELRQLLPLLQAHSQS